MRTELLAKDWADWVALLLPLLISPLLLFPRMEWMALAGVVPVFWLANYFRSRHFVPATPLNVPILLLSLMVWVSLYATFDIQFSLGKVAGTLLGIFVFFGLVQFTNRDSRLKLGIVAFCLGGVTFGTLSLFITKWKARFDFLAAIGRIFPARFRSLPGLEEGFNSNPVGGTVILFLPLLFVIAAYFLRLGLRRPIIKNPSDVRLKPVATGIVAGLAFLFLLGILLLSQSRSAWAGFLVSVGLMLLVYGRRIAIGVEGKWLRLLGWLALILLVAAVSTAAVITWGWYKEGGNLTEPSELGMQARMEIWSRAVYGIQDFPFTGMGMNAFRKVVHVLYPLFTIPPDKDIASAHNHILQAALDLGIPGMVTYVSVWVATAVLLWTAASRSTDPLKRLLAVGLGGGLLAQFVYQTTDAVPLGAKVGIMWWIVLGLGVSLFKLTGLDGTVVPRYKVRDWEVILMWVLFSLLAISFIGDRPYFGLGISIAGGAVLGYFAVESSRTRGLRGPNADERG